MPRSSKAQLTEDSLQELSSQFFEFINTLSSDQRTSFFKEFLTEEEQLMMFKRLAMYWCLLEGYPLVKIQQLIGVTHDTTRLYNKKKYLLSDEFKNLVGKIGKGENAPIIEVETKEDVKEAIDASSNDTPTEIEAVENQPEVQEVAETMEIREEENVEPVEIVALDDQQQVHVGSSTDELAEKMESISNELNEMKTENNDDNKSSEENSNDDSPKKKSGFAKFFGF